MEHPMIAPVPFLPVNRNWHVLFPRSEGALSRPTSHLSPFRITDIFWLTGRKGRRVSITDLATLEYPNNIVKITSNCSIGIA